MLVEDHVLVRMGLVSATTIEPDLEVVAEVDDGTEVVESFRQHRPDVVVLDLRMPGVDGIGIIKTLQQEFSPVRVLVLSSFWAGDDITRAMQEGASGYIVKGMGLEHLLEGIRTIHSGRQYLPREIARRMAERLECDPSASEEQVLRLIAGGQSHKDIESGLGSWKAP
jgi:DNA-binding NarL/FixJ family response regulator